MTTITGDKRVRTLLTMEEVSDVTRIPIATLRWMRSRGDGPPSFKLGRRVVYKAGLLEAWIDSKAAEGVQP